MRCEPAGDLIESAEGAEQLWRRGRELRLLRSECRENLHPLDRVDAEVRFQIHRRVDRLLWVSSPIRNDLQERGEQSNGRTTFVIRVRIVCSR